MEISINKTVRVKLTQVGINFLNNGGYSYKIEDGYVTTQLWDLMSVFGSVMNMHYAPVFEYNNIEFMGIQQDDLEEKVKSLECRINTISETIRVQRNSIDTQNGTLLVMNNALETQCESIKTLADMMKRVLK